MKTKRSRIGVFIIAVVLFLLVIALIAFQFSDDTKSHHFKDGKNKVPIVKTEVNVIDVKPGNYQATITAYGNVNAYYQLTLTSQVSGRVDSLSQQFKTGMVVSAGTLLAKIDDTSYKANVASNKANLASAEKALLEEQRGAKEAISEWKSSGFKGQPDSDLVFHKPQLALAQSVVEEAQAKLANAENDLKYTLIKAPFDAIIATRNIAPGSYLSAGGTVATLYSSDKVEASLPLSAKDWKYLSDPATGKPIYLNETTPVTLSHVETGQQWTGYLSRSDQYLNNTTRQRNAIVDVEEPLKQTPPLLSGTFVKATIKGRTVPGLWRLPSSALSQRGEIWYVNKNQVLSKFSTTPLFRDSEYIYVRPPEALAQSQQQVVVQPLSSYLDGMTVNALKEQHDAKQ